MTNLDKINSGTWYQNRKRIELKVNDVLRGKTKQLLPAEVFKMLSANNSSER